MKKKSKSNAEWNLSVLYKNAEDPRIVADIKTFEKSVDAFVRAYSGVKNFGDPAVLAKAIPAYEKIIASPHASRAGYYFGLRRELNAKDDEAEKRLNMLGDRLTKVGNKLLFFELSIGKIKEAEQKRLLNNPKLAKWRYYLHGVFEEAKHYLTEPEERIMSLKSNTSHGLWVAGTDKMLNRKEIVWKGKKIPFAEANELVPKLPKRERQALWKLVIAACRTLEDVAENELTAIVLDKKTNDELRKFAKPYSATVLGYENTEASVEALVAAVKKNYSLSHRFYRLKAKMMKEKKLTYADRSVSIGSDRKISFDGATAVLREVFHDTNPEYARILDRMLDSNQIDAFPKKGKTGGAFCASLVDLPTYVLMNYVGEGRSLMTYAHEMGHAIHAERAKQLTPMYQDHSIAVAETASTLFENLVFDAHVKNLNKKERIAALHDKIQDDISTVIRQIAFFEFERDMHETIRATGGMNHDELATLMQKHLTAYLGPAVTVTKEDAYTFIFVGHFRRFFYVYSYSYGNLISNAIAARIRADKSYTKQVDRFLTAGSSMSPDDIFKSIGIDVTQPSFFEEGLRRLGDRITELEKLVDSSK